MNTWFPKLFCADLTKPSTGRLESMCSLLINMYFAIQLTHIAYCFGFYMPSLDYKLLKGRGHDLLDSLPPWHQLSALNISTQWNLWYAGTQNVFFFVLKQIWFIWLVHLLKTAREDLEPVVQKLFTPYTKQNE